MRYMIVERFCGGDALPVYRRLRQQGRLAPAGLRYVGSWVTEDLRQCFQVMECENRELLAEWMSHWEDLVDFEVIPVITSAEAAAAVDAAADGAVTGETPAEVWSCKEMS